ncbi:MAG: mechanosensitive ion channel family protein [Desulfobacterales bacterium]|nr:mechanosensitive ion channel family protein [Desulfobacterales bacterium]
MILNTVVYSDVTVFNLMVALLTILGAFFGARAVSLYLRRFLKEKVAPEHADIINKIVYYCIIVFAVVSLLPNIGVKPSGLMVAGGVVGLAVGFACQSIIGNLVSGIFLFMERPIKIGNGVNIDGIEGTVEDIQIMSTTLRGLDGCYIRIPNQKVFTSNITNYAAHVARRFNYVVGIRYSDDADRAIKIIKDLLNDRPLVLMNPEPMVFVDALADNSVNIVVRAWAPTTEWLPVKAEILYRIKQALEKEGIQIPFPQRVVWYGDREQPAESAP